MQFYVWVAKEDDTFAWLGPREPDELGRKSYLLSEGVPCSDWFPSGLVFKLDRQRGIKLTDSIPNVLALLFVSEKLRQVLEKEARGAEVEYLPVRVENQKGKVAEKPYFIANVIGSVRCVDAEKSDFTMGKIDKTQVQRFRRLVLEEKKIPTDARIFRLAEKTSLVLVRRDLAEAILAAGCTGAFFRDIDDFGSEFRG